MQIKTLADVIKFVNEYWGRQKKKYRKLNGYFYEFTELYNTMNNFYDNDYDRKTGQDNFSSSGDF